MPPNTRFYKTFLRKVIEKDGSEHYRKMETRVIVARPDLEHEDGSIEQTALFGTYAWNEDETQAVLVTDPLRNGEPFRDRLITYVTDEIKAQQVRDSKPRNVQTALQKAAATRRYAIPGSERCIQCHMGSPTKNFVLGFTPLQVNRRQVGEGGVIEPSGADELTQLQRLIDYGVITGMDSPADVTPLELSEGDRPPRNDYELKAQGYLLGNCSHCHNPRGFPSRTSPQLVDLLNFLPGPTGGVFQFPLERVSPRISRGYGGSVPMPYITPSLMDYPSEVKQTGLVPKWLAPENGPTYPGWIIFAPWRSVIYRNVDTPFAYADDLALFPHMPMNTAGYDCRAPRILGDWMVSIPAKRLPHDPNYLELVVPGSDTNYPIQLPDGGLDRGVDSRPQPYVEVKSTDSDYEQARIDAEKRLVSYHEGMAMEPGGPAYSRYNFCPDTSDIIDPGVKSGDKSHQIPVDDNHGIYVGDKLIMPPDGVPDRAHWVITDLTEPTGAWLPRRSDWRDILVDHDWSVLTGDASDKAAVKQVVEMLTVDKDPSNLPDAEHPGRVGIALSQKLKDFATKDMPFGIWQNKKDSCAFPSSVPTVASLPEDQRLPWMEGKRGGRTPPADSPLYMERPGAAVFNMICINCHGPNADSKGRQADTLTTMTGGDARVANFRNGLFGPIARLEPRAPTSSAIPVMPVSAI